MNDINNIIFGGVLRTFRLEGGGWSNSENSESQRSSMHGEVQHASAILKFDPGVFVGAPWHHQHPWRQ